MSNKFIWVRNPTVQNGLATTYVSKRGSDTTGDGTAQNPFASIAKATSVAANYTNIMLSDGYYDELGINNGKYFKLWGNAKTILYNYYCSINPELEFHFLYVKYLKVTGWYYSYYNNVSFFNCIVEDFYRQQYGISYYYKNSIIINSFVYNRVHTDQSITNKDIYAVENCVVHSIANSTRITGVNTENAKNSVFLPTCNNLCIGKNNNYTTKNIPENALNSINNATTVQTFENYFNYYDPNDWLKCDFTAKDGSKNIGAGEKGATIGLNQGFAARADGTSTDVFSSSNGATLKNVIFNSTLNGYILQQKDRVCAGATENTITFDNEASTENDYYKGLFVGITEGVGETQIRYIISYNGATRTATVNSNWTTIPDTESEYTISGKIDSVVKDFGKAIKVKRNFTFVDNMTALANGQWEEFLTAANAENEMIPASCYSYEYSVDGLTWRSSTELVSATDGTNYVDAFTIGDASEQFNEELAEFLVFRYIRFHIHIGFNIDVYAEE